MATVDQERKLVLDLSIRICSKLYSLNHCWYGFRYDGFRIISIYKWNFVFHNSTLINKILPTFQVLEIINELKQRKLKENTLKKQIKIIEKLKLD